MMRWLILIALIGCERDGAKTAPAKAEPVPAAAEAAVAAGEACDVRVKRFGDRLAALAKERPGGRLPTMLPAGFALATSPAGKRVDAVGASVLITKDDKVMVGDNIAPVAGGWRLIDESYTRGATEAAVLDRGPRRPWHLYVWADKDAKVSSLAKLVNHEMLDGYYIPRVVVAGDPSAAPDPILAKPSVQKLHESLPKDPEAAMIARAQALRAAFDPCASMPMAFVNIDTEASPIVYTEALAQKIPAAMLECKCNMTDHDVFEYSVLSLMGAFLPPVKYVDLPKLAASDKRTVGELVAK